MMKAICGIEPGDPFRVGGADCTECGGVESGGIESGGIESGGIESGGVATGY